MKLDVIFIADQYGNVVYFQYDEKECKVVENTIKTIDIHCDDCGKVDMVLCNMNQYVYTFYGAFTIYSCAYLIPFHEQSSSMIFKRIFAFKRFHWLISLLIFTRILFYILPCTSQKVLRSRVSTFKTMKRKEVRIVVILIRTASLLPL